MDKSNFCFSLKLNIVPVHNNKNTNADRVSSLDDSGLDIYLKEAQKQGRASAMHFTHQGSLTSDFDLTEEQKYRMKIAVQQHCLFIVRAHAPEGQPQKSRKK